MTETNHKYRSKKICIIGTGKVGSVLFHSLLNSGLEISYAIDKNLKLAKSVSSKFKSVKISSEITENIILDSEVIIIAVQDKNIKIVIDIINNLRVPLKGKIIFHTGGAVSSEILSEFRKKKAYTGSFHPVQTFNGISYKNNKLLTNIYFGIEGDSPSLKYFKYLCKKLGSKYVMIPENKKILYHSACVFASNFLVTHFDVLSEISSGISKEGINIFEPIVRTTLDNIFRLGTGKSLTGPFARGDYKIIEMHLKNFRKNVPSFLYYYVMLGLETLNLSVKEKKIDRKSASEIKKLLLNYI